MTTGTASAGSTVSAHTRGWTFRAYASGGVGVGFPAHAGMDPSHHVVYVLCCGFPRTRGDGPYLFLAFDHSLQVSPHTRGWTLLVIVREEDRRGFPAHAGMDPIPPPCWPTT